MSLWANFKFFPEPTGELYGWLLATLVFKSVLADTRVNHTSVLAVGNYLGSSLAIGILTFIVNSLYGFNYAKIKL